MPRRPPASVSVPGSRPRQQLRHTIEAPAMPTPAPQTESEPPSDEEMSPPSSAASSSSSSVSSESAEPSLTEQVGPDLSTISFAALAEAQDRLGKRKASPIITTSADADANERPSKSLKPNPTAPAPPQPRTSKHAPQQLSSRHQVSRRRLAISTPSQRHHDPRFLPLSDPHYAHGEAARTNYAFLDEYRHAEMQTLASALRRTKDASERDILERGLSSLRDRKRAEEGKEREREVLRRHRGGEREAVRAGKRPYFLKRGEARQMVAAERLEAMGARQREKHERRRQKKDSAKEAKSRPRERRVAGEA